MLLGLVMTNSEGTNVVANYGNDINQGLQKDTDEDFQIYSLQKVDRHYST